jgi:hypothetical protein
VAARQPTIVATSIGFQAEGPDPANLRPGPSYRLAADLAGAGAHPRLCIIATAVGDDSTRLSAAHNAFSKLGFISSHLTLFPMPNVPDVRAHLLAQDVIWVGGGSTANLLALWRLRGLGMDVLAYDPYAPDATSSFDELLAKSDVISVHAPVTPETTGMINADAFAKMRDGVVFLNTARAKIHDTDALVAALASGKVGAAGLDHFEGEHLATDHPLTTFPQVVLTPHIGGATYDTESNHTRTIAEDLCRLMAGARPLNIVNPEVLPS